jgi:hypothetical protein
MAANLFPERILFQGDLCIVAGNKADRPQTMQKTKQSLVCRDAFEKYGFA